MRHVSHTVYRAERSREEKFDDNQNVLSYPGFHQLFFYGSYKNELEDFCKLFNYNPVSV